MISSVDFYNPRALKPVDPEKTVETWGSIYATERLHWASNHANANRMKDLCTDRSYVGEVTPAAIDLFYAHRGCAACQMGYMKHHDQLPSSRVKSEIVGRTVQGDFFYVEARRHNIPVLLLIEECSSFIFLYAFTGCNLVSRGRCVPSLASGETNMSSDAIRSRMIGGSAYDGIPVANKRNQFSPDSGADHKLESSKNRVEL